MQRRRHAIEAVLPAGHRQHGARLRDAHAGTEIDRGRAPFDAAAAGLCAARDEQAFAIAGSEIRIERIGALERQRRRDVEAPAAQHLAADAIAREPAVAGEIEPHLAIEREAVLLVRREPARALLDRQHRRRRRARTRAMRSSRPAPRPGADRPAMRSTPTSRATRAPLRSSRFPAAATARPARARRPLRAAPSCALRD